MVAGSQPGNIFKRYYISFCLSMFVVAKTFLIRSAHLFSTNKRRKQKFEETKTAWARKKRYFMPVRKRHWKIVVVAHVHTHTLTHKQQTIPCHSFCAFHVCHPHGAFFAKASACSVQKDFLPIFFNLMYDAWLCHCRNNNNNAMHTRTRCRHGHFGYSFRKFNINNFRFRSWLMALIWCMLLSRH